MEYSTSQRGLPGRGARDPLILEAESGSWGSLSLLTSSRNFSKNPLVATCVELAIREGLRKLGAKHTEGMVPLLYGERA